MRTLLVCFIYSNIMYNISFSYMSRDTQTKAHAHTDTQKEYHPVGHKFGYIASQPFILSINGLDLKVQQWCVTCIFYMVK